MSNFRVGELYFMIWHPDAARKYLVPDSIVFLGKNLESDQASKDAWYFQDTDSFCTHGPAIDPKSPGPGPSQADSRVYRLLEEDLPQVVDSNGLAAELTRCAERRRLSSPRLQ